MISVCELPTFIEDADKLLTEQERDDLHTLLATSPEVGDLVPGTGGIRKVRIGIEQKGKGKRGGGRVIYYYHSDRYPIALIALYSKGEKIDLTSDEKKELRSLVKEYPKAFDSQGKSQSIKLVIR